MTYKEIVEKLIESDIIVKDFAYDNVDYKELGLGNVKEVYQYGGEGEGDTWESVKYFKDHDVYISVAGSYSSYDGLDFYNDWNSLTHVAPKEVTVTQYHKI